jgi:DegV family protein with EDD domain
LFANKLIKKDHTFSEITTRVKENINNIKVYVVVETLIYLKRGGRIGKIAGTVGEILNIKPLVSIDEDGELYTYNKTRGRKRSLKSLLKIIDQEIEDNSSGNNLCNIDVMHTSSPNDAELILNKVNKLDNVDQTSLEELGPVIGVHTGPGLVGVCITCFN